MNHQHLRAFHAIALEGSISRAARRLGVAQPTLSQQLRSLELRHKLSLFEGRKAPLHLTDAGRHLLELTGKLFATSNEIETFLNAAADGKGGSLRIGSDSPAYAARVVAGLNAAQPECAIDVRIGNANEVIAWLRDGQLDAAIGSDPPMDGALFYLPIYRDSLVAAVPSDHPLAGQNRLRLEELRPETMLLREPTSRTRQATERLLETAGIAPGRMIQFHTREAIREAIALGLGLSFFYSAECPPDPRIRYLAIDSAAPTPNFVGYLICMSERRRTPVLRSLFAAAADIARHSPLPL